MVSSALVSGTSSYTNITLWEPSLCVSANIITDILMISQNTFVTFIWNALIPREKLLPLDNYISARMPLSISIKTWVLESSVLFWIAPFFNHGPVKLTVSCIALFVPVHFIKVMLLKRQSQNLCCYDNKNMYSCIFASLLGLAASVSSWEVWWVGYGSSAPPVSHFWTNRLAAWDMLFL